MWPNSCLPTGLVRSPKPIELDVTFVASYENIGRESKKVSLGIRYRTGLQARPVSQVIHQPHLLTRVSMRYTSLISLIAGIGAFRFMDMGSSDDFSQN